MNDPGVWIRLVLAVLATWRVTHLFVHEDGPGDIFVRLRRRLGQGFAGRLMDCFYCLSVWVAAPMALFVSRRPVEWFFAWLALSGAACLLERTGQQPIVMQPLSDSEGGVDHVLRAETSGGDDTQGATTVSRDAAAPGP
jgi:hypothetical protein